MFRFDRIPGGPGDQPVEGPRQPTADEVQNADHVKKQEAAAKVQETARDTAEAAAKDYTRFTGGNLPTSAAVAKDQTEKNALYQLRLDPEKMLKEAEREEETNATLETDLRQIDEAFGAHDTAQENPWKNLPNNATKTEIEELKRLCRIFAPDSWGEMLTIFLDAVLYTNQKIPEAFRKRDEELPDDWHIMPWYSFDPRYFFSRDDEAVASFTDTQLGLAYLRSLGFENVFLLRHFETDWLGAGCNVTRFEPAKVLGGAEGLSRLINHAMTLGIRMASTNAVAQTSIHHEWFQRAQTGDPRYAERYLRAERVSVSGASETNGRRYVHYRDEKGREFKKGSPASTWVSPTILSGPKSGPAQQPSLPRFTLSK